MMRSPPATLCVALRAGNQLRANGYPSGLIALIFQYSFYQDLGYNSTNMTNQSPNFDYEISIGDGQIVAGVDEVGRGALAGPIVAAAVVFENYDNVIQNLIGVNDSKKLTAKKRLELDDLIRKQASDLAIGSVTCEEIDKIGIGAANILAFKRALDQLKKCDFALIDGRYFRGFEYKYRCLEKGESKSLSIAAASIIAKVYRDSLMEELHEEISHYDFYSNKGYGSKNHLEALKKIGPCSHHRKSFLKKIQEKSSQTTLLG